MTLRVNMAALYRPGSHAGSAAPRCLMSHVPHAVRLPTGNSSKQQSRKHRTALHAHNLARTHKNTHTTRTRAGKLKERRRFCIRRAEPCGAAMRTNLVARWVSLCAHNVSPCSPWPAASFDRCAISARTCGLTLRRPCFGPARRPQSAGGAHFRAPQVAHRSG